jgi:hypothetical protein
MTIFYTEPVIFSLVFKNWIFQIDTVHSNGKICETTV